MHIQAPTLQKRSIHAGHNPFRSQSGKTFLAALLLLVIFFPLVPFCSTAARKIPLAK